MEQALTEVIGNQGKFEALGRGRHNAYLRVAGDNYTKTKHIVMACTACVVLTYLTTCYVIINYGCMFWGGGDSIIGLQKQLKEVADNQSSCESVEMLAKATRQIAELENENNTLIEQAKRNIFVYLRSVKNMTLAERASLRADYAEWERLKANNVKRENRIMFEQIIEDLPPDARARWDYFDAQLKKDKEATIRNIEQKHQKETRGKEEHTSKD